MAGVNPLLPGAVPAGVPKNGQLLVPKEGKSFSEVLGRELKKLRFSQHAQQQMRVREINFGEEEQVRLEKAVAKAAEKGARETLVLMDSLAFVVSVKNTTVITAITGSQLKEKVFTNIDSAVIV